MFFLEISCPKLSPPDNGKVITTGVYPSDVAYYNCLKGFFLVGQKSRVCQRTGEWSGTDVECKKTVHVVNDKKIPKKDDKHDDYYYDNDRYYDDDY